MTPEILNSTIFPAAFSLLPAGMDSVQARAMLLAIGLQESKLRYRAQLVGGAVNWWESRNPPAHGWFQFERPAIGLLLKHAATKLLLERVLTDLEYPADDSILHQALRDNDLLAVCFARALLRTVPESLPEQREQQRGWEQYLWAWRPGKPHPETWAENWSKAWETILRH